MKRQEFFNHIAPQWARKSQKSAEMRKIEKIIDLMGIKKGNIVLDAGCGTGGLIPFISRKIGRRGRVVELDFSEKMLQLASLNHKNNKNKRVHFVLGDVILAPFRSKIFDVIICFALFPHLDDKLACLREFKRVLKAGGTLFVAHPMSRDALNAYHARIDGPVKGDFLPDEAEMKILLKAAGFKTIKVEDRPSFYLAMAIS
ncbi:MAG: class I SAM-dependent methyltransferase [Candidatus Aminicenantales bacterium]